MGEKINKSTFVAILTLIASVITIVVFITGKNSISSIWSRPAPKESSNGTDVPSSSPSPMSENYFLDASIVHFPSPSNSDCIVGGVWKLQGIHSDAFSFSQSVELFPVNNPNEKYYGYATYGTLWSESDNGTWECREDKLDELSRYDYPKGTYGTFVIDFSGNILKAGEYVCKISIIINKHMYEKTIDFVIGN